MKIFLAIVLGMALPYAYASAISVPTRLCHKVEEIVCSFPLHPMSPEEINTRFLLFNRGNSHYHELDWQNADSVLSSHYNASKGTTFIIHGYLDKSFEECNQSVDYFDYHLLAEQLLEKEDLNVILVDWRDGAHFPYSLARQNAKVVGKMIAKLSVLLNYEFGANFGEMHLIGHSLGAHVAGFAGKAQPGYGRITGLDPAGPCFRDALEEERLNASDALFVDCIHTDGYCFGLMEPLGHVDFYPNGGMVMPGCEKDILANVCQHFLSVHYFNESINSESCVFSAYPCSSWNNCTESSWSTSCGAGKCSQMGYNANLFSVTGKFYLHTRAEPPFCQPPPCICSPNQDSS